MDNIRIQANTTLKQSDFSKIKRLADEQMLSVSAFIRRKILQGLDE